MTARRAVVRPLLTGGLLLTLLVAAVLPVAVLALAGVATAETRPRKSGRKRAS